MAGHFAVEEKFDRVLGFLQSDLADSDVRFIYGDVAPEGQPFVYANVEDYGYEKHGRLFVLPVSERTYGTYSTPLFGHPHVSNFADSTYAWVPSARFARIVQNRTPLYSVLPDDGILCHEGAHVIVNRHPNIIAKNSGDISTWVPEDRFSHEQLIGEAVPQHVSYRYFQKFHSGVNLSVVRDWMTHSEPGKTKHFYAMRMVLAEDPILEKTRREIRALNEARKALIS